MVWLSCLSKQNKLVVNKLFLSLVMYVDFEFEMEVKVIIALVRLGLVVGSGFSDRLTSPEYLNSILTSGRRRWYGKCGRKK